jgi:Cu/Ag efflux protein CusF
MRTFLTAGLAGLGLIAATVVHADTTTYRITKIDAAAHMVTLADGKVYTVDASVALDGFKVGDQVKVTFTKDAAGKLTATNVAKL